MSNGEFVNASNTKFDEVLEKKIVNIEKLLNPSRCTFLDVLNECTRKTEKYVEIKEKQKKNKNNVVNECQRSLDVFSSLSQSETKTRLDCKT